MGHMANKNCAQYFCRSSAAGFAALCFASAPASAADQTSGFVLFDPNTPYVTIYGGGSVLDDDDVMRPDFDEIGDNYHTVSNVGFLVGGIFGIRLNDYIRTEGELSYSRWTHDYVEGFVCNTGQRCRAPGIASEAMELGTGGSTNAFNFFGNAWLDFDLWWGFSIYGGGGIGFTVLAYQDKYFGVDEVDVTFAWQGGAGFRYRITETVLADLRWVRRGPINPDYGPMVHEPFEMVSDNFSLGVTLEY